MRFLARGEGEVARVRDWVGEKGWICLLCLARSRIWGGRGFIVGWWLLRLLDWELKQSGSIISQARSW